MTEKRLKAAIEWVEYLLRDVPERIYPLCFPVVLAAELARPSRNLKNTKMMFESVASIEERGGNGTPWSGGRPDPDVMCDSPIIRVPK